MILQLHIAHRDAKDSFYRKVLVEDQMTFEDLNEIIQIIFQTPHVYPYLFAIIPLNENEQPVYIGHNYNHYFQQPDHAIKNDYDELLKNWLIANRIAYYKIGTDESDEPITFMITLEKIAERSNELYYPVCIGAQGFHSNDITFLQKEQVNEQMIIALCNQVLQEQFLEDDDAFDWKRSFQTATKLYLLEPWKYLNEKDVFVIQEPLSKEMLFCSIIGSSGKAFGLVVYPGYRGRMSLEILKKPNTFMHDYLLAITSLNINYCHQQELDEKDLKLIQDYQLKFSEKNDWIQFRSYDAGYFPWIPDALQMMTLQIAMEQTIEIVEKMQRGWVLPTFNKQHLYYGRKIELNGSIPRWVDTIFNLEKFIYHEEQLVLCISEFELAKLKRYPLSNEEIVFDLLYLPEAVQEEPWERPFFPLLAVGIHLEDGTTIFEETITEEKDAYTAQTALYALLREKKKKPKTIYVTEEMERLLKPFTDKIQIQLTTRTLLPEIVHFKSQLYQNVNIHNLKPQL